MNSVKIDGNGGVSHRCVKRSGIEIEYTLFRKNIKNINMRVARDGEVRVSASHRVSGKYLDDFVWRHRDFIAEARGRWRERQRYSMKPERWESGVEFMLLGRVVTISIRQAGQAARESAVLRRIPAADGSGSSESAEVVISVKDTADSHRIEYLFDKWLRQKEKEIFNETCKRIYPAFRPFGVPFPDIQVRLMKAKWGICRPLAGRVTFNARLAMAPQACIDYVAAHELTHFIYADHSKNFYAVLSAIMPDWKKRQDFLNKNF